MADVVPLALKLLYRQLGPVLLNDPKGCREHLLKICPEEAGEIEAVVAALELEIPQRLARTPDGRIPPGLTSRLVTERGIAAPMADLVVRSWASALRPEGPAAGSGASKPPASAPRAPPAPLAPLTPTRSSSPSPTLADLPGTATGWLDRGDALEPGGNALIGGEEVSKVECYRRALGLDPRMAEAWVNLGAALGGATGVTVAGQEVAERACYVRALELAPDLLPAWMNLGEALGPGERAKVGGSEVSSIDCYRRALAVDGRTPAAWLLLGLELGEADRADVGGNPLTRRDCLLRALELDRTSPDAWGALGEVLGAEGKVKVDEEEVDRLACYRKAVTLDPKDALYWTDLGASMEAEDGQVEVAGERVDRRTCFLRALAIDAGLPTAWSNLAEALGPDEVAEVGGTSFSGVKCVQKALTLDSRLPHAWITAAAILRPEELLRFGDRRYTRVDCLVQGLELDGTAEDAWADLAAVLGDSDTVVVGGQRLTREECARRAGGWHPSGRSQGPGLPRTSTSRPTPAPSSLAPSGKEVPPVSVAVRLAEEEPAGPFGDLEVAEALQSLCTKEGNGLLEDPAKFRLLMLGLCPGDRVTIDALTVGLEEQVPQRLDAAAQLPGSSSGADHTSALASLLETKRGLKAEEARWVVWAWGYALELRGFEVPGDPL